MPQSRCYMGLGILTLVVHDSNWSSFVGFPVLLVAPHSSQPLHPSVLFPTAPPPLTPSLRRMSAGVPALAGGGGWAESGVETVGVTSLQQVHLNCQCCAMTSSRLAGKAWSGKVPQGSEALHQDETSDQTWQPAEFKHITHQRKRN